MAAFQIYDTIFKKINPDCQIRAYNNCVPHRTKQFRLILSLFPGGGSNRPRQISWLRLAWDSTLESAAVFGHSVTPEPSKFHLKHTRTAYTQRQISSA